MDNRFCGQCGKPLFKQEQQGVKPTWGLAWGLMWRQLLIALALYIPLVILFYVFYAMAVVSG